jgi:hypothetical protein
MGGVISFETLSLPSFSVALILFFEWSIVLPVISIAVKGDGNVLVWIGGIN